MPKHSATKGQRNHNKAPYQNGRFLCRLCQRPHSLRRCHKFLDMDMTKRFEVVRKHKYCVNCLVLDHSHGSCFSDTGCRHCHKYHHILLHVDPKLRAQILLPSPKFRLESRSVSPRPSTSKARRVPQRPSSSSATSRNTKGSLTSLIQQNRTILLPTVLVRIDAKNVARCLLDSASPVSRILRNFVEKIKVNTLTLREETVCQLTLFSRFDSKVKIEGTFRVDNRITTKTSDESLSDDFKKNFPHLFLADPKFYQSSGIDIVIGVDIYPRVMEGVYARNGLPTGQRPNVPKYVNFFIFTIFS
ncbi:uncharacterized protein LOC131800745 [Musca domestica]|uniref:Uncharacterized protein LOC131800745 n=1 Tax=Musca domestica TaxID=7370 RepID=A0ABM3ULL3_MUSDO|nr:uncharacterized protein LOC131800745 [Musca domestica]